MAIFASVLLRRPGAESAKPWINRRRLCLSVPLLTKILYSFEYLILPQPPFLSASTRNSLWSQCVILLSPWHRQLHAQAKKEIRGAV